MTIIIIIIIIIMELPLGGAKCHPRCDISLARCLLTSQGDIKSEKMKNQHFRAKRKIEKFNFLENYLLLEKKKLCGC